MYRILFKIIVFILGLKTELILLKKGENHIEYQLYVTNHTFGFWVNDEIPKQLYKKACIDIYNIERVKFKHISKR